MRPPLLSWRIERARVNELRDQLASAHRELATLSRELATAERRVRELESVRQVVLPERLVLHWEDGYMETIQTRGYLGRR